MQSLSTMLVLLSLVTALTASPLPTNVPTSCLSDPNCGPIPGESLLYSDYPEKSPPFPANMTAPIPATTSGPVGEDDVLFQNLLSAEWAVFSFYQQGVEEFNESAFTDLGLPNTTYQRITEIRDNEAGHLRIFQDSISSASLKPGTCRYEYGWTNAMEFLALQNIIEISSMAFLTGLAQQAKEKSTVGALVAIGETETRHETWALIDVWGQDPFAGPADTAFPYANQILYLTLADFIITGSCPSQNPPYPYPTQKLPQLNYNGSTSTGHPGSPITFVYEENRYDKQTLVPDYEPGKSYYAVFFHGLNNITVPFDTKTNSSVVPAAFDSKGIILVVIADEPGAPTLDSVVAGPLYLLQQPASATDISAAGRERREAVVRETL